MAGAEPHASGTGRMDDITHVRLDVHKATVCVAVAESGRGGEVRQIGVREPPGRSCASGRTLMTPVVKALQAMGGVALVVAVTAVAEVSYFRRFANARQLMAYLGWRPASTHPGIQFVLAGSGQRAGPTCTDRRVGWVKRALWICPWAWTTLTRRHTPQDDNN